MNAKREAEGVK